MAFREGLQGFTLDLLITRKAGEIPPIAVNPIPGICGMGFVGFAGLPGLPGLLGRSLVDK